ncbi:MAG: undecaprenyl-diphosphate phosphatase [Victivallales bacterium]|nr:undecaprenyl-diphosphate phosphatase [Victivallales bacterium]
METSLFYVIFMALIQGIAEFLPISSSGHLALLSRLGGFDAEAGITLNIVLHGGTLLAIVVFYFRELGRLVRNSDFSMLGKLALATVPVGIIGVIVKYFAWDATIFNNLWVPACGFLITASLLLWSRKTAGDRKMAELSYRESFLIGLVQAAAVLPGVSRSGSTIAAGLKCKLAKADAAGFSFLLAIPAIGGVVAVKLLMLLKNHEYKLHSLAGTHLLIGFAVAAVAGYFSLRLLLKLLQRGDFKYFSWYLYALGIITLTWAVIAAAV